MSCKFAMLWLKCFQDPRTCTCTLERPGYAYVTYPQSTAFGRKPKPTVIRKNYRCVCFCVHITVHWSPSQYAMVRSRWRLEKADWDDWWPRWVWVGECFFWYRLTRVVLDRFHTAVNRLCVCVCTEQFWKSFSTSSSPEASHHKWLQSTLSISQRK